MWLEDLAELLTSSEADDHNTSFRYCFPFWSSWTNFKQYRAIEIWALHYTLYYKYTICCAWLEAKDRIQMK
jgi:hypothetical protein